MSELTRNAALVEGLAAAVPLRIWELEQLDTRTREIRAKVWASEAVDQVAHRGDDLLYGSKKSGGAAKVFNALAKGLAALAYCPGGVTFAGRHWCVEECLCPAGLRRGTTDATPTPHPPAHRQVEDIQLPDVGSDGELTLFDLPRSARA